MKRIDLIPRDKSDIETAQKLKHFTHDEIEEIIPELLEWLQDMNWPVARHVADYLLTIINKIETDILKVLKGNDLEWKDCLLVAFGTSLNNEQIKQEIIRLAIFPSETEISAGLSETAKELVEKRKWI